MQNLIREKELLENARLDPKKFDELYRYFVNDVYRFAYSILNNQHDAEDITSQTFIDFYKKLPDYQWQEKSLKSWLFQTVKFKTFNKFRLKSEESITDENLLPDEIEISFVDVIMQKDLIEKVKEEIEKLSPIEKSVINLRIWEGMSYVEIGEINGITEDASRMKFNRAITKLRSSLEKRNIKALFALPVLFTCISQLGASPAYAAPAGLIVSGIGGVAIGTTMSNGIITTIKTFLSTHATAVTAASVAVVAAIGGGAGVYIYQQQNRNNNRSEQVGQTPTPTLTNTPTQAPSTLRKYSSNDLKLEFEYPQGYTVTEGSFTTNVFKSAANNKPEKTIRITSPSNKTLNFILSNDNTGCAGSELDINLTVPSKVDNILFTRNNQGNPVYQSLWRYSWISRNDYDGNKKASLCDLNFGYFPQGQSVGGYLYSGSESAANGFFYIVTNDLDISADELKVFDSIVGSAKRIPPSTTNKTYEDEYIKFDYPEGFSAKVVSGNVTLDFGTKLVGVSEILITSNDGKFSFKQQLNANAGDILDDDYDLNTTTFKEFTIGGYVDLKTSSPLKTQLLKDDIYIVNANSLELRNRSFKPQSFPRILIGQLRENRIVGIGQDRGLNKFEYMESKTENPDSQFTIDAVATTVKCGNYSESDFQKCGDLVRVFLNSVVRKK